MDGWMDGRKDGWMDGRESGVKDCLQQSKNQLKLLAFNWLFKFLQYTLVSLHCKILCENGKQKMSRE